MSEPDDDELIERLKESKNKKDALEEKIDFLEAREDILKVSLLDPITEIRSVIAVNKDHPRKDTQRSQSHGREESCLQDSLVTVLNWVKRNTTSSSGRDSQKDIETSLIKAIKWASYTNPDEEDRVLRKLLEQSLLEALNWVKNLNITEKEEVFKQQLIDSLMVALKWTSQEKGDDQIMIQSLEDYLVVACNWTKISEENHKTELDEANGNYKDPKEQGGGNVGELEEEEREKLALQELQHSLEDIYDWVKSIDAKKEERPMQNELLDSLVISVHWMKTAGFSREDEVMKQLLQETFLISLNWVIAVDEEEGGSTRQRLIDYLIFAINWATSSDSRGNDEVMRTLLRLSFKMAVEWKNSNDQKMPKS